VLFRSILIALERCGRSTKPHDPIELFSESSKPDDSAAGRYRTRLEKRITANYEANKLVNVLDHVEKTTGVPIRPDWAELEAVGVEEDLPITLQFRDLEADTVIRFILRQAGAGAELEPISHDVTNEGVRISSRKTLYKELDTRVYTPDYLIDFGVADALASMRYKRGGTYIGGIQFASSTLQNQVDRRTANIEAIKNIIMDTIGQQDDWIDYDGAIASLMDLNGNLIIKAPPSYHHQIELLLARLNEAQVITATSFIQHRQIMHLVQVADELRLNQRYEKAQDVLDEAKRIDPEHDMVVLLERVIRGAWSR